MIIPAPYGVAEAPAPSAFDDSLWHTFVLTHPDIQWERPAEISTFNGSRGFGCRICILRYGIAGQNVSKLPQTLEEFEQHRKEYHPAWHTKQ